MRKWGELTFRLLLILLTHFGLRWDPFLFDS